MRSCSLANTKPITSIISNLDVLLDEKLTFQQHINNALSSNKKKLRYTLQQKSLFAIYKAFLIPLIDYRYHL